ncbi:hypothetical protein [Halomarina oriensis]|uniref:Uncharacterized protein n=1 Tax=Halomarina oriensis TaxID=671145 RepID=A0A6B0GW99_9EURY|nr:hypothetical protein [Halomarina oriensis]MWG36425.1 hypothetical protein [Halomarina oriensis]
MNCISCGLGAGYNRAVVDTVTDTELGGFCFRCEESEFGRCLDRGDWTSSDGCALCDRDGYYALPEWKPYHEAVGGRTVCKVDYCIDAETLRFCDEHFLCLRRDDGRTTTPDGRPGDTRHPE